MLARMLRPALAALVLLAGAAAPASGADVTFKDGDMTITGAPGESSRLTVRFVPNLEATVHDDARTLRPGFGCLGTSGDVSCAMPAYNCHPCSARFDLADGNDTLSLAGESQKSPFRVDAGPGDDVVHIVGDARATVTGGPGNDVLGADTGSELDGAEGADVLQGGRTVTASYAARTAGVTVTLDGVANDGAPGEGDNVTTGTVLGGEGADALTGDDAPNELGGGGGDDVLTGAGGDDTLRGDTGKNRLDAGAGDDHVAGSPGDAVTCGAGADVGVGLAVPGAYGDCESVFETTGEEPYLTVSDVTVGSRRPRVTLGWHQYPGVVDYPIAASGFVEMRYHGRVIARGSFTGATRPAQRDVGLALNARGRALACRAARNVRLLVVAVAQNTPISSRSATRRDARLPRVGTCAKPPATKR